MSNITDDGDADADIEEVESVIDEESESLSGSGSGSRRSSVSANKSKESVSIRSSKSDRSARSPSVRAETSFAASEVDIVAESSSPQAEDDFAELEPVQVNLSVDWQQLTKTNVIYFLLKTSVSRRKSVQFEKSDLSSVHTPSSDARYRTMTLSTPGSNDFTRGYIDQDETYTTALDRTEGEGGYYFLCLQYFGLRNDFVHNCFVEIDTDREEDFDSSRITNKGDATGITDVSGLREEGASFLHTISPSNKKYIKNNPPAMEVLKQKEALRKNVKGNLTE